MPSRSSFMVPNPSLIIGLIDGIPTLCGGYSPTTHSYQSSCSQLEGNSLEYQEFTLTELTFAAAYTQYGNSIIYSGGCSNAANTNLFHSGIGIIDNNGVTYIDEALGENTGLVDHCMVQIEPKTFLIIGGRGDMDGIYDTYHR